MVNDISRPGIGFDAPDNEVTILTADGTQRAVSQASKTRVASAVLDELERLLAMEEQGGAADRADARSAAGV